ncbi:phage holin, lambda family [Pseudomonas plecoglossicida]|uniref:phage holin, lambda family n=1 Tax=Pseudomonas TaxID=286 RepID=UPI0002A17CBA|nr:MULTISPECIES: phage holin, lambda family [Pseudomonas]CAB5653244.1 phage holin, lambda family [Pseudomonas putida]AGA74243.1 holin-like protein [Pseudomonas putida HB3267]MCE0942016.1 phage holin, lambda family [Pseudomonas asiatica]MCE1062449.1 phage holin, lambda family [Pseudomonas asiatica]MCE1097770.1 phage holin, lambda family [Pseudomonas asiatica]
MPDRPETWAFLATWLENNWPGLYAGLLAALIAALRVVYGGGKLRQLVIEAPLCGFVALSASHGLSLIGIPLTTAPFFGGLIGLLGIEFVRAAAKKTFTRKEGTL